MGEEWQRLENAWDNLSGAEIQQGSGFDSVSGDDYSLLHDLLGDRRESLDLFDKAQLACVIRICRESRSLSEAGRTLFAESRKKKSNPNDADRLRKYLASFGLDWGSVR